MILESESDRELLRKKYWDDFLELYSSNFFNGRNRKALVRYFSQLYFGKAFQYSEKLFGADPNFPACQLSLLYQKEQNPDIWQYYITHEAPKFGLDTFEKLLAEFKPLEYQIYGFPMRLGWSPGQDLEYFRFWWGDNYDPASYRFMGSRYAYPYSGAEVCNMLGAGISLTLSGTCHHECRYVHLYDYWKQALLSLDPAVFYPASHKKNPCFSSLGTAEAESLMQVKIWLATILRKSYREYELKKEYGEKRNRLREDHLPCLPYGMDGISADSYWNLPNLVALRSQLQDDIENGVLPKSIAYLNNWASYSDADIHELRLSTKGVTKYTAPSARDFPAVKKKRIKTPALSKSDMDQRVDSLPIDDALVKRVGSKLEHYRKVLHRNGVPVVKNAIDNAAGLKELLKANKYHDKSVIERLEDLSIHEMPFQCLDFLIPDHVMELHTEPFAATTVSGISGYYRKAWRKIHIMTRKHNKAVGLKATQKKFDDEGNNDDAYKVSVIFTSDGMAD